VTAAKANIISWVSQPTSTTAGSSLGTVAVQVQDKYTNPIVGLTLSIALSTSTVTLNGRGPATADSAGQGTFPTMSINKTGTYTVTVAGGGLSIKSAPFTITAG